MSATSTVTKPPKARAASAPVEILDNDAAQLYTHVHPLLVLSFFLFRFKALVANPVTTLYNGLLPLAALQIAYVTVCLPPVGGSGTASPKSGKGKRSVGKGDSSVGARIIPALLSLLLSALVSTPLLFTILILHGAPLTTHLPHTLLLAAHISLLSTLPLVYVHGVDGEVWRHIAGLMVPVDEVFGAALGALLGAWIGAVPIPLDWDREWQKWPCTVVAGVYGGWVMGKVAGGLLLRGKTIRID